MEATAGELADGYPCDTYRQRARVRALAVGDALMMRKQLRNLKALAEATPPEAIASTHSEQP